MPASLAPAVRYDSLVSRSVFVSGGGSGIGAAIVRAFAEQGCRVTFVDLAREPSEALVGELSEAGMSVRFTPCDITDLDGLVAAIEGAADAYGPVTVLVNNAANDQRHALDDLTPDYWDERMAVNLKHHVFAAKAVAPMMREAGGGAIVNMGSISWRLNYGGMPAYVTAKAGVEGLTRGLARELGPHGIRVNCIAPGWILTERQIALWLTPEAEAKLMIDQCLKRRLDPVEVAKVALFLASDEASACTAQTFTVDGGWI
ncbi:MAG TPA: SDR family NAD(P)-dependent oxidoreductase [Methylomirabilota bacterium]|nr:SDR family NAD(P)-dependent oxidoreductase [Methylomirabilota bacterium]